jgi:3-methyladenine DNA glycosylase AlkD
MIKPSTANQCISDLRAHSDPKRAALLQRFFKTAKGEYAEGDVFWGLTVTQVRAVAKNYRQLPLVDVTTLLASRVHEVRLASLVIMTTQFAKGDDKARKRLFDLYLESTDHINNWDLVDVSAPRIVGAYLFEHRNPALLKTLARSKLLWERRIAILSTAAFIGKGDLGPVFAVADILIHDPQDLMHKAVGWMLREAGKRNKAELEAFLKPRYAGMPRTMLRYAIERFPERERAKWLSGKIQ